MEKARQSDIFIDGFVESRAAQFDDMGPFESAWMWLMESMQWAPTDFQRDCFALYALSRGFDDSIVWMEVAR